MYDATKVKVLTGMLFKQEIRGKDGTSKKLVLLFISYILPGIFLPLILYKQNSDPTGFEFSFLTFLFFSIILAFTIIAELNNLIVSKTEIELFSALPVDDELIVHAKLHVTLRYIFIISLPLLIPGAVYYFIIIRSVSRSILYFVSGFMMFYFLINFLMMFYSIILKKIKSARLNTYVLVFQIVLIFVLVIGYQFVTYSFTGYRRSGIDPYFNFFFEKGYLQYFPQAWFGFIPARQTAYGADYHIWLKVILPVIVCWLSYLSLKYYLITNYSLIRERFLQTSVTNEHSGVEKKRSFFVKFYRKYFRKHYLRNSIEDSSFSLVQSMFLKDRVMRLNILPMMAVPVGMTIFALFTNQLPAPFGNQFFLHYAFHLSILLTVLMAVNTAVRGVKVSGDTGAGWLYDASPIENVKLFKNGIRKFFVLDLLIPLSFILFILFMLVIPPFQALVHTLYIFICANLFNSLYHIFSKEMPFTKENTIIHSIQRITSLIYPIIFGVFFFVIQFFAYNNLILAVVVILAIATVNFWLNYYGFVRTGNKHEIISAQTIEY
jgi:hypothetical protein